MVNPSKINIALIGDCSAAVIAHQSIPRALRIAASANQLDVDVKWLDTATLVEDVSEKLSLCQQAHMKTWMMPWRPFAMRVNISSRFRMLVVVASMRYWSLPGTLGPGWE